MHLQDAAIAPARQTQNVVEPRVHAAERATAHQEQLTVARLTTVLEPSIQALQVGHQALGNEVDPLVRRVDRLLSARLQRTEVDAVRGGSQPLQADAMRAHSEQQIEDAA
jgi:hypothetical protein